MKVIKCDQCSKIIEEAATFFVCTCKEAVLIGSEVIDNGPVIIREGAHFCNVTCVIGKLLHEWREYNESH